MGAILDLLVINLVIGSVAQTAVPTFRIIPATGNRATCALLVFGRNVSEIRLCNGRRSAGPLQKGSLAYSKWAQDEFIQ